MVKSDMKYFTNAGLINTKSNYEELLKNFKPEHYKGITEQQLRIEYTLILLEICSRIKKQEQIIKGGLSA
jgi:hypothetical protein